MRRCRQAKRGFGVVGQRMWGGGYNKEREKKGEIFPGVRQSDKEQRFPTQMLVAGNKQHAIGGSR